MTEVAKKIRTSAIVDLETGQTLIAHPTKDDVFVKASHFTKLAIGAVADTHCTYVTQRVCVQQTPSASSYSGYICTSWADVQTCDCD